MFEVLYKSDIMIIGHLVSIVKVNIVSHGIVTSGLLISIQIPNECRQL